MLNLIMAVSDDDFVARGPDDDMTWTPPTDKQVFRLLTSVGGVCGAGSKTALTLPPLKGRQVIQITRRPWAATGLATSLHAFYDIYPDAWLLGGPTVAQIALEQNMVSQVYLCRANRAILGEGIKDRITPFLMSRGEHGNVGIPFKRAQRISILDVTVDCWSRVDVCQ